MLILRWAFLVTVGVALVVLAVANRDPVTLRLLPDDLAVLFPVPEPFTVPAFLAIFAGILIGLLIGFIWEWMRERKHRQRASARRREIANLETEVDGLKKQQAGNQDEILALLD